MNMQRAAFTQGEKAEDMIEIGIGEQDVRNRAVAKRAEFRLQRGSRLNLQR